MNRPELRAVQDLARCLGVQLAYRNINGKTQLATFDTLQGILHAFGLQVRGVQEARDALQEQRDARLRRGIEPVVVAWDGRPVRIEVHLPRSAAQVDLACRIQLETGESFQWSSPHDSQVGPRSRVKRQGNYQTRTLQLPPVPLGYHRLQVEVANVLHSALLVSAPTKTYAEPHSRKEWGVFVPMYALHSASSWGAGNLTDWHRFAEWVGQLGGRVVGSLPMLSAFLDSPFCEPGPYSPASRLFWNEFYLDITKIPEFKTCKAAQRIFSSWAFQQKLQQFRDSNRIDYAGQMRARRQILECLSQSLRTQDSRRRQQFQACLKQHPETERYARFRAVCDHVHSPWRTWPERQRHGKLRPGDYSEADCHYYGYTQWVTANQVEDLVQAGGQLRWYLDFPLGVHPDGYDLWREPNLFVEGVRIGAPPDPFFSRGQDWGFSPLHPQRLREEGYRYWLDALRFQLRQAQMLRIDHVMGLHRLYWIPEGFAAQQGAYVTYPAEELFALLSLESHRHQVALVGENLGTVPAEVNASMKRHELREMYVLQFSQNSDPRRALSSPPSLSMASMNTHDMPTFAAHWRGLDILDHARLGLIPQKKVRERQRIRKQLNLALARFLVREGYLVVPRRRQRSPQAAAALRHLPNAKAALRACLNWLAASSAETVLVTLEDLWLEERPQNVPGTSRERPNWRRKTNRSLEQIERDQRLARIFRELTRRREQRACLNQGNPGV